MRVSRQVPASAIALVVFPIACNGHAARAADLLRPALPDAPAVAVAAPDASGWYLRADVTESFFGRPADAVPADPKDPGMPPLVALRLSHEEGYGGGVGYRVNSWLRFDATVDQRSSSSFSAYSSRSVFKTGYNVEAGKLDVLTGLVNVYADLGTWWGITPYVGAGLGFAEVAFDRNYTQTTCLIDACDGGPGKGPRTSVARPSHDLMSFAWGLSAGASYRIWDGLSLDASYRYLDLGTAKSGVDAFGGSTRLKDLTVDEIRIGLRYQFAGGFLLAAAPNSYGN